MRKGKDVIVLPGGHDPTREFADFAREVFHLHDNQVRLAPAPTLLTRQTAT